jgi:ketosteroid isomerase-like protein
MRSFLLVLAATLLIGAAVLPNLRPPAPVLAKDNAETLRQLEADFLKATSERGSEGYLSYYAEDAVEVPDGAHVLQGKESIARTMGFLDDKQNQLTWTPIGADISASGDLGYTYGTYEFRSTGKDGKPTVSHGKYTTIWKKQGDGKWKVVLDMGNSSSEAKST